MTTNKVIGFLSILVIFSIALAFSLKNLQTVRVDLFFTAIDMPLALALTVEFLVGVILGLVVSLMQLFKLRKENQRLQAQLNLLSR